VFAYITIYGWTDLPPSDGSWTTNLSPEIKDPPPPNFFDLSVFLKQKSQFFHSFLSKKKAPIKGPKFLNLRKSLQEFESVNCRVNQIGNLVNRVLDL
jgi:hypothetical protein